MNRLPSSQDRPRWQTETVEQAQLAAHIVRWMRSTEATNLFSMPFGRPRPPTEIYG